MKKCGPFLKKHGFLWTIFGRRRWKIFFSFFDFYSPFFGPYGTLCSIFRFCGPNSRCCLRILVFFLLARCFFFFFFLKNFWGGGGWAPQAPRSATAQSGSQKASPMNFKNEKGKKREMKRKINLSWLGSWKNLLGNFTHLESAPYC